MDSTTPTSSRAAYFRKRRAERTPEQTSKDNENQRQRRLRRIEADPEFRQQEALRLRRTPLPSQYAGRNPDSRPKLHDLGQRNARCTECNALHFSKEKTTRGKFSSCCGGGQIKLPQLLNYPQEFKSWLTEPSENGKNFRTNIRKYNSAFAFASFGHQTVKFAGGPQVFAIHGQVYHKTAQSFQNANNPTYAQLYILDPEYANRERANNEYNESCTKPMFDAIDSIIRQINPFANAYKMMKDLMEKMGGQASGVQMWITNDRQHDPRRYNLPVANEVAAVFVSDDGEPPFNRDIAIHPQGNEELQNIKFFSPNCDPMTYPLLFPRGEPGWQPGIERESSNASSHVDDLSDEEEDRKKTRKVSMPDFYSFRLQQRTEFNPLLHAGKLTQQFIVDAFLKVEAQRIQWNRQNQKKLRVDLYMGLMDYVNSQAERKDLKAGRIVILPSSFAGGKRFMQQNYQDAMVLVAKYGKPDLFITFTCNPKWKEITSHLEYNETAIDRPELVATVFYLKLKELMNDLLCDKGGVLGKVKAYTSVIEFQKRGLPHCHMLLILDNDDKIREPVDVDTIVCAEIPDTDDVELYDIVKTCMSHGPCGEYNKKAPCMAEDKGIFKCSKDFPKQFCETTNVNVNGYPLYRRRNDGKKVIIRNAELDNRWVVPYNPFLTRKYSAHINVELCSSVQSVKYIFKYIYKGHDAAVVQVNEANGDGTYSWDEIKTFLDTRYISAPESMWRLRKYDMSNRSHAVERLPVHLPSQQTVVFEEGNEETELQAAERRGTKLTKWFLLNQSDPDAREFLYSDIPYHYVWRKNNWKKRQRGAQKILPRMYTVSPRDMERFCLRLLLSHVKGAQSYEDLKYVAGIHHETFFEAAKALKLLDDDEEWDKTMEEACIFQMPSELRQLFSAILVHARPTDSKVLYEKYLTAMCEDYIITHSEYMAVQMALKDIQDNLAQFGYSCQEFGLPTPTHAYDIPDETNLDNERHEAATLVDMMNTEQRTAFDVIMSSVNGNSRNKCFFLSGAGGCGKTFIYKALTAAILGRGGLVKSVAPTGLAATLLKGGKTVHSGFGITINLTNTTISRFKQGSAEWKELLQTKLIIWDEISMCHVHLLNAVDRSLRDLLNCQEPFGGIPIVVGGDFQQQAPVVLRGNRVQIVEACVKSSPLWRSFKELKLIKNMRVNDNEVEFAKWLLSIGCGKEDDKDVDFVKLSPDLLTDNIVATVFGENINQLSTDELASRTVLCPKNEDTLQLNDKILSMLEGTTTTYFSVDSVSDCESEEERSQYPLEFLNSLTPMGMAPHSLRLKKGCCIMLLRNLNPRRGLCNGTRLIVESMGANLLECSIFSGAHRGEKVFVPRIALDVHNSDLPFKLKRKQFPVRLAYSMTITKSQGQTFDRIGVYLPEPVFTHGQLYTAFSRVRSKDGLSLQIKQGSRQGVLYENDFNIYTYNCVYREILK